MSEISWDLPYGEPNTLDPAQAYDYSPDFILSNLCDPLLRQNADFTISPGLATYTQSSPLKLVFTIRPDAKFWDGHPVTSADVVYDLERDREVNGGSSDTLFEFVRSITASGPRTVVITFTKPDELFLKEMSSPSGDIYEKAYAEHAGSKLGTAQGGIMCSGPYELKSWQPGNSITLTANEHYWDTALRPKVATVKVYFVTDTAALTAGLLSGEFDGAYEVPAAVIPRLRQTSAGRLSYGQSSQSLQLTVMHPGGITANPDFSKAIWTAIDRAALAKAVYYGAAQADYTAMSQGVWDPAAEDVYAAAYKTYAAEYAYNPTLAASLVKKSGYTGQPVTLAILAGDATQSTVAQLLQAELAQVGIKVKIDQMQAIPYSNSFNVASARQGVDLELGTNYNQVADPLEFMGVSYQPGSEFNYAGFDSPQAWNDIQQAHQELNAGARAALLLKAQALTELARGVTSLVDIDEVSFLSSKLTGAVTSFAYMFMPSLAYVGGK